MNNYIQQYAFVQSMIQHYISKQSKTLLNPKEHPAAGMNESLLTIHSAICLPHPAKLTC